MGHPGGVSAGGAADVLRAAALPDRGHQRNAAVPHRGGAVGREPGPQHALHRCAFALVCICICTRMCMRRIPWHCMCLPSLVDINLLYP